MTIVIRMDIDEYVNWIIKEFQHDEWLRLIKIGFVQKLKIETILNRRYIVMDSHAMSICPKEKRNLL